MKPYDDKNVFAKILRGEMPCHKVYEDDNTFVFMDLMPRANGHCLVIPKRPARNILDADEEMLAQVMATTKKIAKATIRAFDADGVTVQQFNETAGGQMVFHLHVHVIPRTDGVKMRSSTWDMENSDTLAQNAEKLRAVLAE